MCAIVRTFPHTAEHVPEHRKTKIYAYHLPTPKTAQSLLFFPLTGYYTLYPPDYTQKNASHNLRGVILKVLSYILFCTFYVCAFLFAEKRAFSNVSCFICKPVDI